MEVESQCAAILKSGFFYDTRCRKEKEVVVRTVALGTVAQAFNQLQPATEVADSLS